MEYIIVILLVALSGLFSGLTLGLLGLNLSELERKIKLGDKDAKKVYSVRKRGNLLLCTLLLGNVAVNSVLAVFLGSIASGVIAALIATGLIVIFGEIIPQAAFSRYALKVGAKTAWLVKVFIFVLYPITAPIAWALDKALGSELPTVWTRDELKEIIKLHEDSSDSSIDKDEERIILGALSYSDTKVADIMTPRTVIFALEVNEALTAKMIKMIKEQGFSRIPVYKKNKDDIVGILYVKDLIGMKVGIKVSNIYRKGRLISVTEDKKLDELLNEFIRMKTHLAFVFNEYKTLQGIVSLEDVIEEVLKIEIVDEEDLVDDLQELAKKKAKKVVRKKMQG